MNENMQFKCIMIADRNVQTIWSLARKENKTKENNKENFFSKTIDKCVGWMYNYARSNDY